jgi:hypothetical protein
MRRNREDGRKIHGHQEDRREHAMNFTGEGEKL